MDLKHIDMHDLTSVSAGYRVYPKNSGYPHCSIELGNIQNDLQSSTYSFTKFHWSESKAGVRVGFSELAGKWSCDLKGFVIPAKRPHVDAAKQAAKTMIMSMGGDASGII